jgi:hypothetical protein
LGVLRLSAKNPVMGQSKANEAGLFNDLRGGEIAASQHFTDSCIV